MGRFEGEDYCAPPRVKLLWKRAALIRVNISYQFGLFKSIKSSLVKISKMNFLMKEVFLAIMFRTNTWAGELFAFLLVKDFFDGTDERFAGKLIFRRRSRELMQFSWQGKLCETVSNEVTWYCTPMRPGLRLALTRLSFCRSGICNKQCKFLWQVSYEKHRLKDSRV